MIFLAQTNTTAQLLYQIFLFGGIFLIIYLFMILPQRRKQQAQNVFRESLKEGAMVVTIGGLHGKIHEMDAETITLIVDKNTKLVFDKLAISPEATRRLQEKISKQMASPKEA